MSQSLESLVATYGYPLIAAGALAEGESVLVVGGVLAHRGYLSLPFVLLTAFVSTYGLDQLLFRVGRTSGRDLLARRPRWARSARRVDSVLGRHGTLLMLGFRYLYGMRVVAPIAIGASSVGTGRFAVLNLAGAAAWTLTFGVCGYLFGAGLEAFLGDLRRYETWALGAIVAVGAGFWVWKVARRGSTGTGFGGKP